MNSSKRRYIKLQLPMKMTCFEELGFSYLWAPSSEKVRVQTILKSKKIQTVFNLAAVSCWPPPHGIKFDMDLVLFSKLKRSPYASSYV